MKNKILLGSVTVLSALVFAACGNSTKETKETTKTKAHKHTTKISTWCSAVYTNPSTHLFVLVHIVTTC